jgi:hypothetical protein
VTQITNKMAQEWQTLLGQSVSVKLIAERYGVNPDTVYRHTNPHLADRRREQWRNAKRLRAAQKQDPART